MQKFSIFSLARNALTRHENWSRQWRSPDPKTSYDVVIIGGGGHGLVTAYYLAKEHGITDVAVLEKGWLGGGNTGRNTTIVRSNYLWDESANMYEHALKLWEGLSRDLNYNVMFSQRGVMNLAHNLGDVRESQTPRLCQSPQRRRRRVAGTQRRQGVLSDHRYLADRALPGDGGNIAKARRCGAP